MHERLAVLKMTGTHLEKKIPRKYVCLKIVRRVTGFGHLVKQLKPHIFDFLSRVARITSGRDRGRFPEVRLAKVGKRHFLVRCEYFTSPFFQEAIKA